jgi:hypothetical protein
MRRLAVATYLSSCFIAIQPCMAQDEPQVEVRVEPIKPTPTTQVSPDLFQWQTQARDVLSIVGDDKMPAIKRSAAYDALMKIKPKSQEDTRFQLSYVLLAINQKRNADALKLTEQIVSVAKNDVHARALQARLMLLTFKTAPAIVELESLIEALRDPAPTSSPAQLEHAARFLGLAVGYFSGPGRELIRPTTLAELVVAAQELPDDLKNAYESSKLAIEEEYRVLTEEGEEALKALREGLEKEAAAMREQLEAQRAKAANEAEYAKMELQTNFSQLSNQWQNAWNASQTLSQQGNNLIRRQLQLQASLAALPQPLRDSQGRVDFNDQQRYLAEVNALQSAINALDYQIFGISSQFDRVRAQGILTERQMASLQARAQQYGMSLAMQNESFNRLDNAIRQKEMAAGKAEPKKKSKEQLRRERAFSTYDDFNIHKEKKLLLDAIALDK